MNNKYSIYNNFSNINFSSYTNNLISGTISGNTLHGNINSIFIGSGDPANFVTNQEFSYLTGITSNLQLQINNKVDNFQNYLTYSASNNSLINSYNLIPGLNITANTNSNNHLLNIKINSLTWGQIYDQTSGDVNSRLTRYSPVGWNDGYPNNATEILINPQRLLILQSISGQSDGRICKITNVGKYPIIIQNSFNTGPSDIALQIIFSRRGDYVLRPNSSVSFIYTSTGSGGWICTDHIKNNGFDYQDMTTSIATDFVITAMRSSSIGQGLPIPLNNFVISAHTSNIPNTGSAKMVIYSYGKDARFYVNNFDIGIANKFYGIGQFGNNQLLNLDKKLYVYQSTFSLSTGQSGVFSSTPVVSFGFQNTYNSYGYSAATNSFTSLPNLGGGIFFIGDSGYSNNFIYLIQTNDGSSITGQTNLPTTGFSNSIGPINTLGMSILTSSGNSLGETTFYIKNDLINQYTVFNPVQHTGTTLTSYPSFYIYPNRDVTNLTRYNTAQSQNFVGINNINFLEHSFI